MSQENVEIVRRAWVALVYEPNRAIAVARCIVWPVGSLGGGQGMHGNFYSFARRLAATSSRVGTPPHAAEKPRGSPWAW